jgi:protein O-GlcNAc transferase
LMAQIFELHDRNHFRISAYSYGPNDGSVMRKRLEKAFDQFIDIRALSDEAAAKRIYEDGIDILVDLTGYTQHGRSAILALRPAPIQVNYLGYPGTMGAGFVDYLIADQFIIPPEQQEHYTEKVVWLPDCYMPRDISCRRLAAPRRKDCGLPDEGFVFCSFNLPYKITPDMFDIWCRLLKAVPGSVLWLPSSNPNAETNLSREAESRGVAPERIIRAPRMNLAEEHLARIQCADLFLDTTPYNAHTTCSDALWMGLPVITCVGKTFPSRVAGSLLTALGVPELITYSLEDYYTLALDLATDRRKYENIRNKIIANRESAPLFDSTKFTRHLEQAYRQMWDEYVAFPHSSDSSPLSKDY